jgi:hypothetical protein
VLLPFTPPFTPPFLPLHSEILKLAAELGVAAVIIGRTGGERLVIKVNGEQVVNRSVAEVEAAWRSVLPEALEVSSLLAAEESLTS